MFIPPPKPPIVTYFPPVVMPGSPVTLQTAKMHLRAGGCYDAASADAFTAEDTTIGLYLAAAARLVEDILGRALLTQTWTATFSSYDNDLKFVLDRSPMQIASIVAEALIAGTYTTILPSVYIARKVSNDDTFIRLAPNQAWPVADKDDAAYRFTFSIGYGVAAAVPPPINAAILLVTGGLYENREDMNIGNAGRNPAVVSLLRPYMAPAF